MELNVNDCKKLTTLFGQIAENLSVISSTESNLLKVASESEIRMGRVNEMINNLIAERQAEKQTMQVLTEANGRLLKMLEEEKLRYDKLLSYIVSSSPVSAGVQNSREVTIINKPIP